MDSSPSSGFAYIIVGALTCVTTLAVAALNRKYSKRVKPDNTSQAGYSEWVAYLEREIKVLKAENKELQTKMAGIEQRIYERDNLIARMRARLLELSRKYNEDVSSVI